MCRARVHETILEAGENVSDNKLTAHETSRLDQVAVATRADGSREGGTLPGSGRDESSLGTHKMVTVYDSI